MVGFAFFSAAKTRRMSIAKLGLLSFALSASADERRYSTASYPLQLIFHRWHGSGAAAVSAGAESALTAAHKNALIAVRNEAAATNDAVPRACG